MSDPIVPICIHTAVNGKRCQLVALRGRKFCYFHDEAEKRRRASARITRRLANRSRRAINIPVLEDANAIQLALMETINALIDQRLDHRDAGLLFYALQTASANVKSLNLSSKDPNATHAAWLKSQKKRLDAELAEYQSWQKREESLFRDEIREELKRELEPQIKRWAEDQKFYAERRIADAQIEERKKAALAERLAAQHPQQSPRSDNQAL